MKIEWQYAIIGGKHSFAALPWVSPRAFGPPFPACAVGLASPLANAPAGIMLRTGLDIGNTSLDLMFQEMSTNLFTRAGVSRV